MKTRTTFETVRFAAPFSFQCLNEMLPAGEYTIETDSELLEGVSFPAWRRLMTLIHLPVKAGPGDTSRLLAIDRAELDSMLSADRETHERRGRDDYAETPRHTASNLGNGEPDNDNRPSPPHSAGSPA